MCAVSNVGDHYTQQFQPFYQTQVVPRGGLVREATSGITLQPPVSRDEFDRLFREVTEMKQLLLKAKEIDEKTNQPDCEQEEKVALLKAVAKAVGVDLSEVFKDKA